MMMWMWISMIEVLASTQQRVGAATSRPKEIMEPHSAASDEGYRLRRAGLDLAPVASFAWQEPWHRFALGPLGLAVARRPR